MIEPPVHVFPNLLHNYSAAPSRGGVQESCSTGRSTATTVCLTNYYISYCWLLWLGGSSGGGGGVGSSEAGGGGGAAAMLGLPALGLAS